VTLKWRFKHYFSLSTSVGATVPMFRNNITKPASSMLWLSGQAFFIPVIIIIIIIIRFVKRQNVKRLPWR